MWHIVEKLKMVTRRKNSDPLRLVVKQIFEGTLETFKESITKELIPVIESRLLSSRVPRNQSLSVSAVQNGKKDILLYLLNTYKVNIEQETSTVIEGGHPVDGATPLWTASTLGYLDMVIILIDRGADIEHATDSQSTPLRGAAFDGHIDVVEYLIKKGANIDKPNQVGQSPLTIAAAMKQIETVEHLIANGANVHQKGHNGDMPLHVAVESGSKDVTKVLVKAGAENVPNNVGYTPAILACCYGHRDILEFLHSRFTLDDKQLYDCYCLLQSKEVLNSNMTVALEWANKAIALRAVNSFSIPAASHSIYDGIQELSTLDEAKRILFDNVKSFFLCAVYCERILGPVHPTTPFYIRISGDMALEEEMYDKCMQLWLRSLEYDEAARMAYELQIIEDLLFSVRGFARMIKAGYTPQIVQHFEWGIQEFKLSKASKISESDVVYCLCRMLAVWIMAIDSSDDEQFKKTELVSLKKCTNNLMNVVDGREPPLLIACLKTLPISSSPANSNTASAITHSNLPLHKVVSLFLDYGCPLNSEDEDGNFPLHLAVSLKEDSSLECIKVLVEAGVHVDAVNHKNESALEMAKKFDGGKSSAEGYAKSRSDILSYLQQSERKYGTLKCLCAKAIVSMNIQYNYILPNFLVTFVSEHDTCNE